MTKLQLQTTVFVANQEVHYKANGGTAINVFGDETTEIVAGGSANAFTLSATEGGALIDITGTGNNALVFLELQLKQLLELVDIIFTVYK